MDINVKTHVERDGKIEYSKDGTVDLPLKVKILAKFHKKTDLTIEEAINFGDIAEALYKEFLDDFSAEIEHLSRRGYVHFGEGWEE